MGPRLGQFVISAAGRDKGRCYIVVKIIDDTTVEVMDGTYRKVSNPKRKNIRHLMMTRIIDNSLRRNLLQGAGITNEEVCEALKIINKAKLKRTGCSNG